MLEQVPIDDLQPGMYVNQVLEQTGTLKMRSKGVVKTQAIIDSLKAKGILTVEVDLTKSKLPQTAEPVETAAQDVKKAPVKAVGRDSINEASDLYNNALTIQSSFLKSLQNDAVTDLSTMESLSHSLIESVFDNKDADVAELAATQHVSVARQNDTVFLRGQI